MPESVVELEADLDHQEFLDFYQPEFDKALSSVQLKGFRLGTAPKEMAEKAVDKEKVFNEAASDAVRDTLKKIMAENDWQFIDQPKIELLESEKGLKFKAVLSVFPNIKLGDYKKIAGGILKEKKEVFIEDEEIGKAIDWVLNSRAKLIRVYRAAQKGDAVEVNFSGFVDGKKMEGATDAHDQFVLGQGKFVPGFEENIMGRKNDEKLEFSVDFPKDYWKEDLRDKKVDFKVEVRGVFERQLPELNDEFVRGIGKFENVESFKKNVKEGISKEKETKEKERLRLKILDGIIRDSKMDLPKVMVGRTLDNMVEEYKSYAQRLKKGELENEEGLKNRFMEKAKNSVAVNLVLYQIAKEQNLEPSSEDVEKEANDFLIRSQPSGQPTDKIDPKQIYDYIYGELRNKKVFEYLESLK